jgi:hypothetical protein
MTINILHCGTTYPSGKVVKMQIVRKTKCTEVAPGSARDKPNSCDETGNDVRNLCVDKCEDDDECTKSVY